MLEKDRERLRDKGKAKKTLINTFTNLQIKSPDLSLVVECIGKNGLLSPERSDLRYF